MKMKTETETEDWKLKTGDWKLETGLKTKLACHTSQNYTTFKQIFNYE
ncbi:hypothetical protein [Subsaximicrobium wynnwilliamsii]|nr:hypothetical protein [Subsaximicrobium wynnwilliamsii]